MSLEEMMTEREVSGDGATIYRWVQTYGPALDKQMCRSLSGLLLASG